jgi:long-chain acyl-CoA synthetase
MHGNLLHQTGHQLAPSRPNQETEPIPGETAISILPVWHITECMFELGLLSHGCSVAYLSICSFKNDLAKHKPVRLVLVPHALEKIAIDMQNKFSSGSPAVKTLAKLFTETGQLQATHTKVAKGLVVANKPPSVIQKSKSKAIMASLAPVNALGDNLV